jgi:hypothetical protein
VADGATFIAERRLKARRERGTTMENDIAWQNELARRARIYEDIEAGHRFEGKMGVLDYAGMTALTLVLVVAFWIWGA